MHWTLRKTGLVVVSASAALATWTNCDAGLFDSLFSKKDKCELPRRLPARDCAFGYFPTNWRPWDTCCDQPENAPVYYGPESAVPYDEMPQPGAVYEGAPTLTVPTHSFPGSSSEFPNGASLAPQTGPSLSPGVESPIPVPSAGPGASSFRAPQDPSTIPQGVAPLPPEATTPGSAIPGPLYPATPSPGHSPLPTGDPGAKTIYIPDPAQPEPLDSSFVPPVPGTARYTPMRRLAVPQYPLQPTSHSRPADRTPRRPQADGAEWRVMRNYYDRQPAAASSR